MVIQLGSGFAAPPPWAVPRRHPFRELTYAVADEALVDALAAEAGAWPRDPMDRRLMADIAARRFESARPDTNPANDALLPAFDPAHASLPPADGDRDAMPDDGEIAHGLDPHRDDSARHRLTDTVP